MSIEGRVRTLFSDKEKTEALFPRTKISAVSDDNGVGLDALLSDTVYTDVSVVQSTTAPINADTLDGRLAEEYATKDELEEAIASIQATLAEVKAYLGI